MFNKNPRLRRAAKSRGKIARLKVRMLTVHRSSENIYAQIINPIDGKVLAAASSLESGLANFVVEGENISLKKKKSIYVGKMIAERAMKDGLQKVAFDRSGFKFHGRIKLLADTAREAGMEF